MKATLNYYTFYYIYFQFTPYSLSRVLLCLLFLFSFVNQVFEVCECRLLFVIELLFDDLVKLGVDKGLLDMAGAFAVVDFLDLFCIALPTHKELVHLVV